MRQRMEARTVCRQKGMIQNYKWFSIRQQNGVTIIELATQIDYTVENDFASELMAFLDSLDSSKVLVSFLSVTSLTSAAIGCLIAAQRRLRDAGGKLKLCEMTESILDVFRRLRLAQNVFEIHESERDALAAFER